MFTHKAWWKEMILYQIYVRSFQDSNGDGIGDIRGIIQRLDYLQQLGVDALWLNPIFESPQIDNGYDVSDYYSIDPLYGTIADLDELITLAHMRDLRIFLDLVPNHTSDQHLWFQASRENKNNAFRDWYIWKDPAADGGPPNNWISFFGGSAWTLDSVTGQYYLHLFHPAQPDLNWENPSVRAAFHQIVRFWLAKGIDGFRMDALPFISKPEGYPSAAAEGLQSFIREVYTSNGQVHQHLKELFSKSIGHFDACTIGETTGVPPSQAIRYTGRDQKELSMMMPFSIMELDEGSGGRMDPKPFSLVAFQNEIAQWHNAIEEDGWLCWFTENHDFPRAVSRWTNASLFYQPQACRLLGMLLMTLKGTPCVYMGQELGLPNPTWSNIEQFKDNAQPNDPDLLPLLASRSRDNARVPMPWDATEFYGFSSHQPWIQVHKLGETLNVSAQLQEEQSTLYWFRQLLQIRKLSPELSYGHFELMTINHPNQMIYKRQGTHQDFYIFLNWQEEMATPVWFPPAEESCIWVLGNYSQAPLDSPLRPWEARLWMVDRLSKD